jgi:DNA processing protein
MRHEDLFYVLALLQVEGIGDITAKKLLNHYPEASSIFKIKGRELQAIGIGSVLVAALKDKTVFEKAEAELRFIENNPIEVSYFGEADYPERLKHCIDGPVCCSHRETSTSKTERLLASSVQDRSRRTEPKLAKTHCRPRAARPDHRERICLRR